MPRAIWNGAVLARSEDTQLVEGNVYFPPSSVDHTRLCASDLSTVCGWKGTANYYSVEAGGKTAENAAWTYREPKPEAANIRDYVAFYPAVTVER